MNIFGFCDDAGNIELEKPGALTAYIREHMQGQAFMVTVKRKPRRQGSKSMRYYRGVVVPDIAVACGYDDPDEWPEVHSALAWKFLRISDHPQLGTPRRRSTSKGDLSAEEMTDYIHACIQWAETSIPDCRIRRPEDVDVDQVYAPDYDSEAA